MKVWHYAWILLLRLKLIKDEKDTKAYQKGKHLLQNLLKQNITRGTLECKEKNILEVSSSPTATSPSPSYLFFLQHPCSHEEICFFLQYLAVCRSFASRCRLPYRMYVASTSDLRSNPCIGSHWFSSWHNRLNPKVRRVNFNPKLTG